MACGQRVENPCPLLLSPCHEGERPQRKLGDREVKASLKGKGQSPAEPCRPRTEGCPGALGSVPGVLALAPAASCCSDLGRGQPPTCPGGPPTPSRQQRLGGAEGTPRRSLRGASGPEGQSTPVCPQGWPSPAEWGHGPGAPPGGGARPRAPAGGGEGSRGRFSPGRALRPGLSGAPWGRGVHRGWQLAKGAPGRVQLWGRQSQQAAAFSLTADHPRLPAPLALLPFPPGQRSWPHPIQGELQGLPGPLQGPAPHSLSRLSPEGRSGGRGVCAAWGLQTRPPPGLAGGWGGAWFQQRLQESGCSA